MSVDLRASGVEIWRDIDEILPGQNWELSITDALGGAVALLFISSRNSRASTWMAHELKMISQRRVPIIPIIIDNEGEKNLPKELLSIKWVDFRKDYEDALREILSALPVIVVGKKPISPKIQKSKGYVFVNYAEEDKEFVSALKVFLMVKGYAYWDYDESDRDYHTQLFRELEEVILNSAAVLSVISPAWRDSDWAPREYVLSRESKIPAFLLLAKPTPPILIIAGDPYIDFVKDANSGYAKLARELERKGLKKLDPFVVCLLVYFYFFRLVKCCS